MSSPFTLKIGATQVFNALTEDLPVGGSRKVDNAPDTYMAVHVERLTAKTYSICHYFEQNGDLCQDPEVVFLICYGWVMPVMFQQALPPVYRETVILDGADQPTGYREAWLKDLVVFCNTWLRNVSEQQGGVDGIRDARASR